MRDEYRCGVVGELRGLAKGYADIPAWSVIACGELPPPIDDALHACGLGRAAHASEICDRLADLIEQEPERTCRDEGTSAFRCGRCGAFALRDAITDLCGPIPIRYCPNCGARVEVER